MIRTIFSGFNCSQAALSAFSKELGLDEEIALIGRLLMMFSFIKNQRNVLFYDTLEPLVIDFSPTYAPYEYANALALCDNIAWNDLSLESLRFLQPEDLYKKVIKYAVAFRVMTVGFFNPLVFEPIHSEWKNFEQIWKYCNEEL